MNYPVHFKLLPVFARFLLIAVCVGPSIGNAEDTDLFLKPSGEGVRPNVLFAVDTAANNESTITLLDGSKGDKLTMLQQVLNVVANPLTSSFFPSCTVTPAILDADGVIVTPVTRVPEGCTTRAEADTLISTINLGLMLMNPSGATKGGYISYHVRPMDVQANRDALSTKIAAMSKVNNAPYAKMMHEAYLYFAARPFYAGFSTNPSRDDAGARDGSHYRSPINGECQPNYLMFLGNGGPDSSEETDTRALLTGLQGVLSTDPIQFPVGISDSLESSWFDEYARTLKAKDVSANAGNQNITTYTVAIQDPTANNFNTNTMESSRALLQSAALAGGGEYALGTDAASVLKAIFDSLRKMQPVNSVFAAVTLPVSVNTRGAFLNQVYMGQFRPDENARPRWPGNLKQYQISLDVNGNPFLADRNGQGVEDTANGFMLPDRTSFWTTPSSYWGFTGGAVSDAPDGSVVEKGGAAQRMRTDFSTAVMRATRKIYTCNGPCGAAGTSLSSVNFNASNSYLTDPATNKLAVANAADRTALIDWVRGADNVNNEDKDGDPTDNRAYIHGDLLHSRPAVINYNRYGDNNDVMVYYGANDGIFHAIKGGQRDDDGSEKWGMVFPEFFGKLKVLRNNSPLISPETPKPYFADGSVSVYQNDANHNGKIDSGDQAHLYIGMRRGGRFAYALNVTDPDDPKFLWKIDATTTGFSQLGQTWSTLRPTSLNVSTLNGAPAIIFGGGYHTNEDSMPATASSIGRGVYVVNGATGALIKHLVDPAMGAMPADVTVLDRDKDGNADRIYAPDTKGNVWRMDIADPNPGNWKVYQIASLGGTGSDARKFLNKIDVVYGATFDTLLLGSGDREHPTDTSVVDRFYMLMDKKIGVNAGGKFCGPSDLPVTCTHANLTDVTLNPYQSGSLPAGSNGWYITFATGEKLVNNPVTVYGTVIFGTNTPTASAPGSCGNLGEARIYQIGYKTGNAVGDLNKDGVVNVNDRYQVMKGGGLPPSGTYSWVEGAGNNPSGSPTGVVCVGTRCFKPEGGNFGTTRHRTYWYKKQ